MSDRPCRFCGQTHGVKCPIVQAIEYFPDGSVKRVEFVQNAPYAWIPTNPYSTTCYIPYYNAGPSF